MLGLYPPTAGQVLFQGEDIFRLPRRRMLEVRRQLQIVFQDPYTSLDPRMRVGQIVAEPLVTHGVVGSGWRERRSRRERVANLLESVGLRGGDQDRYPHEFSGGQRQRVGIARALALDPKLLILDEPVSALDVSIQAQVLNLLQRLQRDRGIAYVLIGHDLSVMRRVAARVAVMYLGRVVELARTEELFTHSRHPYTRSLLSAVPIPDPGRERQRRRIVLRGEPPSPSSPPSGCSFHSRCPKAVQRCAADRPVLDAFEGGHLVACHYPVHSADELLSSTSPGSPALSS
jgi:peptide/nickel transport system ATP-binding protein/oligopeptide transport system ATP-binding protein